MNDARPLRLLFSLIHSGYLRGYGGAIRILAEQGHTVHIALGKLEKEPGDTRLARELAAEYPNVTFGLAPTRPRHDPWRPLAWLVRAFMDLSRYIDPRYAEAPALRDRVALKIRNHVRTAKQVDPVTGLLCRAVIRVLTHARGERPLRRALRIFATLERAIPTNGPLDRFMKEFDPDAVLVVPLVEVASPQVDFLKSAKRLGIRTGVCISSWDNLTNKGLIRIVPDRVYVWNDVQRREAVEMHGIPHDRVVLSGAQRFDEWFERQPEATARELKLKVGLDPDRPYVLYLCSSPFIAPDEVSFVTRWAERLRAADDPAVAALGLLVRPHPVNAAQWRDVDFSRFGNVAISPRGGAQPDAGEARSDYFHSLVHSAAVVGINTSGLIESAVLGKSVFTVLDPEFARTQKGTLHFHYLLRENGGFLDVAESLDEHVEQLSRALAGAAAYEEQTRRFVASFVRPHGLDRPATPILAAALEELARMEPPAPERTPPSALALRAALSVVAAFASAFFALDRLFRNRIGYWLLTRGAAAPLARRLEARRAARRTRPDLPPKPPLEVRRFGGTVTPEVRAVDAALERLAGGHTPVVAGAWTGSREHELLYWLPFLAYARERFDLDLVESAGANGGVARLPASLAVDLVRRFRNGTGPIGEVLDRLRFERLAPPPDAEIESLLPDEFVAVAFSGGPTLPADDEGRLLVQRVVESLAARLPVVAVDVDAGDPLGLEELGVARPLAGLDPVRAWHGAQRAVVARASGLVGEFGALALLGPPLGVPTVALYGDARVAVSPDLDVAYRAARAVGTPLVLLDAAQIELATALAPDPAAATAATAAAQGRA